ncbi:MAG: hypothetical protein M1818_004534 [Claussenomyces sp. TS43310]|nr:MAG: hypothetical protein M1818_004534 [Claussenomyces sp. TS43310]
MTSTTNELSRIFKRDCITCPSAVPTCPVCPDGQQCSITVQTCETCQVTRCVPGVVAPATSSTASSPGSARGGPNVGAIAGGVVGGLVAMAVLTYLVWRFCVKNKRQQYEVDDWVEFQDEPTQAEKDFAFQRNQRASTHTVGSIASTVLTRASNIIQIAYIPGMSNRSTPSASGVLVPPVPPIPIALSSTANSPSYTDEHFFMPGDLRDSTYSGMTDRTSYATRNSVASTIYGKNAVVSPVNPQTVIRGKAAVVSVKTAGSNSPGALTPPVPSIDYDKYTAHGPPSPAFSVGSTFLNSASAATAVRPNLVRLASGTKSKPRDDNVPGNNESQSNLGRDSTAITIIEDTPAMEQGEFSHPTTQASAQKKKSSGNLSAVIEEATKRAHSDVQAGLGVKRGFSPFGDEYESKQ